ncbi:MAG: hypothetical protein ACJ798_15190 [Phenylobacterium sp.]
MSIIQFLRILWAYRLLTALTTAAMVVGAIVAILVVPARYEASTRVMLDTLKPDQVTGRVRPDADSREFLYTQIELIKDYGVAGQAVDQLGWTSSPQYVQAYNESRNAEGDMRRWLAQQIIERTKVNPVVGTNILNISFWSTTPNDARAMANALRDAYVAQTLATRRRDAMRNADWFTQQATKEKDLLDKADQAKTDFEKESGIVMQDDKTDVETARLRSLTTQSTLGGAMISQQPLGQNSAAGVELAAIDAQIAQASKTLGPNHPTLLAMKARRATMAKIFEDSAENQKAQAAAAARAASAGAGVIRQAVEQQTSKVIANRAKIERLTQLQSEVNLHREQLVKSLARAAELRQEAAVADPGITVLSEAVTPHSPSFPKKGLILGGAVALGGATGLLLSLILEFLFRRVRGIEDLEQAVAAPLLAVITPLEGGPPRRTTAIADFLRRLTRRPARVAPA